MKITVINNRNSGGQPVPCVDSTSCAAGTTHEMPNRSAEEVQLMMGHASGNDVIVLSELEAIDREPVVCVMKTPVAPGSGVGTNAANGFDLETQAGGAGNVAPQMYFGVFDDAACTTPAVNATLDTAATGTIDAGAASNLLTVTPSAAGVLSVTLTDAEDEEVYLKAWPVGTSYTVDCSDSHAVEFIA